MRKLFFDEHIAFIRENVKGIGNVELTERINAHFGTSFSVQQVKSIKAKHHLSSGLDGRFNKGHLPINKGRKMTKERYEKCKATMFEKGHKPSHFEPIGTEKILKGKYIYVKVADKNNANFRENWRPKHHLIWEQHYGKIPKGHRIIFADKNTFNLDIENMLCLSVAEIAMLNRFYKTYENAEMTKTSVLLAKIRLQMAERRKNNGDNKKMDSRND